MSPTMSENVLFVECLELLSPNVDVLSSTESGKIWNIFKQELPITFWGRINWDKIEHKKIISFANEIVSELNELFKSPFDTSIYILWNDASVPVIKTDLNLAIKYFDDVVCVAPDTWFLNLTSGYVVEVFHGREMTVGLATSKRSQS